MTLKQPLTVYTVFKYTIYSESEESLSCDSWKILVYQKKVIQWLHLYRRSVPKVLQNKIKVYCCTLVAHSCSCRLRQTLIVFNVTSDYNIILSILFVVCNKSKHTARCWQTTEMHLIWNSLFKHICKDYCVIHSGRFCKDICVLTEYSWEDFNHSKHD